MGAFQLAHRKPGTRLKKGTSTGTNTFTSKPSNCFYPHQSI